MPRTPFDAYSKDFLDEFLSPTGGVTTGKEIQDETRQIDVWYTPDPNLEDTLLLRLLGRGRTLERAIAELLQLPPQEKRDRALQLLANWKVRIEEIEELEELEAENRELVMSLSPAFIEWEQRTRQEGRKDGRKEGIEQRSRLTLETLLLSRFGKLDSQLEEIVAYFAHLSSEDYARQLPLLLSLSYDELTARFGMRDGNRTQE